MKRNYNHTSDNETETLTKPELKDIIQDIDPESEKKYVSENAGYIMKDNPTWMFKPDQKGGFFKIRFEEATYKRNIKNGWKLE